MAAARSDRLLCWVVADTADEGVLSAFTMFLQYQIRMVCNLTHLHDETEYIGIIIQHYTTAHIRVELPGRISHDTLREVPFDFTKEFIV